MKRRSDRPAGDDGGRPERVVAARRALAPRFVHRCGSLAEPGAARITACDLSHCAPSTRPRAGMAGTSRCRLTRSDPRSHPPWSVAPPGHPAAPTPSYRAVRRPSTTSPTSRTNLVGGRDVHRELARAHSVGEAAALLSITIAFCAKRRELDAGAEDNQLAEFDPVMSELMTKLVQRRLHRRRFRDRVTSAFGRHNISVAPVSHRLATVEETSGLSPRRPRPRHFCSSGSRSVRTTCVIKTYAVS